MPPEQKEKSKVIQTEDKQQGTKDKETDNKETDNKETNHRTEEKKL